MSQPVTHGNDPESLRAVADALQHLGDRVVTVGEQGSSMTGVLGEAWAGPDLDRFTADWQTVRPRTDAAADMLKSYAGRLREDADEQVRASGGEGSRSSPFAGARAKGEAEAEDDDGWGLPSWDDVKDTVGDLKDKAVNSIDEWTSDANEWWKDTVADSWLGRQVQLRLEQGAYWIGEASEWVKDQDIWVLSPVLGYVLDTADETVASWAKYINDPKGTFLDDWEDSGWLGRVAIIAGVVPIGRLLKKPADDVEDVIDGARKVDPPRWSDDFTEKGAKRDSSDPQEAAEGRLNDRAQRYVDRYGLDEPEDVWDTSKIDPQKRGFIVEAAQGGNLPGSYRTWDKYEVTPDGRQVATSIKSIDPSLPSYADGNAVESTLKGYVDDVAGATTQDRGGVRINPRDLDGRELEIVTPPEGFTADQLEQVHRVREYADERGIDIVVKEYP